LKNARLTWEKITLQLRNPFRLSYGVSETRQAYWIRLAEDAGWGEGTIPPYYGVDPQAMTACWEQFAADERPFPDDPAEVAQWVGADGPAPARSAIDLALYDRIGRLRGLPLYQLLGLPEPQALSTSFTIAIDTPDEMARLAGETPHLPIIKLKFGSEDDVVRLAAVRQARPDAKIRVDANAGWTFAEALRQIPDLLRYDLEMIEQPLPRESIEEMGELQKVCPIPIVADESVQTLEDIERLASAGVQGINVKLMKVGGISQALQIIKRAHQLGLRIMLGCMVETSIGTTAMAHFTGFAEWVDLDAPLLISNDPFDGISYGKNGQVYTPDRPGIGVVNKA
jgi:L-alanine-DL-glutamate epimerase-like enolase superfamily enzyme